MNKFLTKIAKIFLGLSMAAGVGVAIGTTTNVLEAQATSYSTGTLPSGWSTSGGSIVMNNVTWTYGSATYLQLNSGKIQVGSKNNPQTNDWTIQTPVSSFGSNQKITSVSVTAYKTQGTATYDIYVGSSSKKSGNLTTSSATYTANNLDETSGDVKITLKGSSNSRALYWSNITVVYETAAQITYTVTVTVNDSSRGQVSQSSVTNVAANTSISSSGATLSVGSTNVTASPKASSDQYDYAFSNWSGIPAGGKVTGNITVTANFTATTRTYNVTNNVSNASFTGASTVTYGTAYSGTFTANSGYILPASLTSVTIKGTATNNYSYNSTTGAFSIAAQYVTGAIVINGTCPASGNTYSISTTVTNGTYSGDTTITDNGGVASVTIAPTGDYKLPASVSVSGASHTYNDDTGVISLSNATGNVTISAAMVALTEYSITVDETNGSHTGASTIKESRTASLTFTPALGYGQPSSVTVSGATSSWTRGTGVLSLSNPTGNVTVKYTAAGNELDSISISTNSGSYKLGDNFVMPTVTAKYTVNEDADVTSSASYSGYDPYTTGSQPVTISYTEGGITKTQSYTANVSAQSVGYSYNKISSVSDITEGDYIIAYSTYGFDNRDAANGYTTVTISNDSIAQSAAMDKLAVHITPVSGGYTLQVSATSDDNAGKYINYTTGGGSNTLKFEDSAQTIPISLVSSSSFATHASGGAFAIGSTDNVLAWNDNSGNYRYRFYKVATTTDDKSSSKPGLKYFAPDLYKKVSSGSAELIRITATYKGGDKYVGDPISTSDFTVKKQLNTGNELTDVASGYTISANTLTSVSNSITVSYTEGNITKTAVVVVPATPRSVTLVSVELVQGENVVKEYVDWSGAEWDFTDLSIRRTWSDESTESFNLADLVESEDASVSPAKPAVGVTSFTVSYEYLSVSITNASVTGISVVADYVESVSWGGKSLSHFKAFSGGQLTSSTVSGWTVKATYAGAGETNALSFGTGANQFSIRIGDSKAVTSLPYTWTTADDNQFVYVVVGGVAKGDSTYAKANICATINAIDHTESQTTVIPVMEYTKVTSLPEMSTGDTYQVVIAANVNGTYYAMSGISNNKGQSYTPSVSNNGVISENAASYVWILTKTANGYTISDENGTLYTGTNTNINVGQNGTEFSIISGTKGTFRITPYTGSNRPLIYRASTYNVFGGYAASNVTAAGTEYYDLELFIGDTTGSKEETTETTVHYANDMEHFDAQKKVVEFAKFMNTTMNGTNVCSGTFANLESAWGDVAGKYDALFGASTTLNETELAWAKNMLKYATAAWGSDAEAACVEKAMKTYEHCVSQYGLDEFMSTVRSAQSVKVSPLVNIIGENTNTVAIIVIISMVSVTAIGGYFFLRKRKENN